MNNGLKKMILLLLIPAVLFVVYVAGMAIGHTGKTKVELLVVPRDAAVSVNGQTFTDTTLYLTPGTYTFTAKRDGFDTESQTVDIKGSHHEVDLLAVPNSPVGNAYLNAHPDEEKIREDAGSKSANEAGLALQKKTPLIAQLPYTDITGPFSIDYGPSSTQKNGSFILISDSSPNGRVNALKWIKQQGYDPVNMEIHFDDFTNPLVENQVPDQGGLD
jgi:hypothetical protein